MPLHRITPSSWRHPYLFPFGRFKLVSLHIGDDAHEGTHFIRLNLAVVMAVPRTIPNIRATTRVTTRVTLEAIECSGWG